MQPLAKNLAGNSIVLERFLARLHGLKFLPTDNESAAANNLIKREFLFMLKRSCPTHFEQGDMHVAR